MEKEGEKREERREAKRKERQIELGGGGREKWDGVRD